MSLRQRLLRHTPAATLLVAAGVLERRRKVALALRRDGIRVEAPRRGTREFGQVVASLAHVGGWRLVAGPEGPHWAETASALVSVGLLTTIGTRLTLDEPFYFRLQTDPEHRHLWDQLHPWVAAVADALTPALGA